MSNNKKPIVAIVGRPNVGKSALFNRLIGRRKSIVADREGVTRDRIYHPCTWEGREFILTDTGGIDPGDPDVLRQQVFSQVEQSFEEADVLLLVVDVRFGIHPIDQEVAGLMRRYSKESMLVVNKLDSHNWEQDLYQFYALGLGDPVGVSAVHGSGTGDLLDHLVEKLPSPNQEEEEEDEAVRICLLGRPNVGKSSLLNYFAGSDRSIVHDEAGTTRDSIEHHFEYDEQKITLIDTAGLRRQANVEDDVEYYSRVRSEGSLEHSDVALLMIDAQEGVVSQDQKIAGLIKEAKVGCLVVVNKWDLIVPGIKTAEDERKQQKFAEKLLVDLDFISWAPVIFISAKEGFYGEDILPTALGVYDSWRQKIPTSVLNQVLREVFASHPPPSYKGKQLKLYYASQTRSAPPKFHLKVNSEKLVHFSYERYLLNQLRQAFGFVGAPIELQFARS